MIKAFPVNRCVRQDRQSVGIWEKRGKRTIWPRVVDHATTEWTFGTALDDYCHVFSCTERLGYATPRSVCESGWRVNGVRIILLLDRKVSCWVGGVGSAGALSALPEGPRDGLRGDRREGIGKSGDGLIPSVI